MAHEISRLRKWVYDSLKADATLTALIGGSTAPRIYAFQAPEGATLPYVIFQVIGGFDTQALGTTRVLTQPQVLIKVVSDGPPNASAMTIADRIDAVIGQASAESSESYVFSAIRQQPVEFVEPKRDSSAYYTHSGGIYRCFVHPVAL